VCACVSFCLFVNLVKLQTTIGLKCLELPKLALLCVIQCSGFMQYIRVIAVGVILGCMCFKSINIENIYWFLFPI
jgi:hypothetical protein